MSDVPFRIRSAALNERRRQASEQPVDALTSRLVGTLSVPVVARASGVQPRAVGNWVRGMQQPTADRLRQLHLLSDIVETLASEPPHVPHNWMICLCPGLDERAPADVAASMMLPGANPEQQQQTTVQLLSAAEHFTIMSKN